MFLQFINKNNRHFIVLLAIAFFGLQTPISHAQNISNDTGFINGIWYSQNNFFASDNIRIYAAFQNRSGFDLVGRIQFIDNDKIISDAGFESINGQIFQKWSDWKVTYGKHSITVKIIEAKKSIPGESPESIRLPISSEIISNVQEIDIDTDNDKIGNAIDTDDDNDGISDLEELKNGTDPLTAKEEPSIKEKLKIKAEDAAQKTSADNLTQKITDVFKNTGQTDNKSNTPVQSFLPTSIADKISFATTPISTGMIGEIVAVLEEKRDEANQILNSNQTTEPIFWNSLSKLSDKYPKITKIAQALPSSERIQYNVSSVLAFILKTPLILALSGLALIYLLWKLTKIFA